MSPLSAQVAYAPDLTADDVVSENARFHLYVCGGADPTAACLSPTPAARLTSNDFLNQMLASVLASPRSPWLV